MTADVRQGVGTGYGGAGQAHVDVWALAKLPGGLREASFLTVPEATQYRLIVDVLLDQQQVSLTGVGEDGLRNLVVERLTAAAGRDTAEMLLAGFDLSARMRQLVLWGSVDAWDDRSLRPEDFLRNATRYQLTTVTAQLARVLRHFGVDDGATIAATFAPAVLVAQLDVMTATLASEPEKAAEAWAAINPTLSGMADAAASWQARLASALAGAVDERKVSVLQDTLLRYVEMWGAGVDTHSDTIAERAATLRDRSRDQWRSAALSTLGADADGERVTELVGNYLATLSTLCDWFSGPRGQARMLRRQMRDAIAPMIRGQRTLAAVGGHVSRRAELLALAGRLDAAGSDVEAWQLWATATGLFASQHLALASPQPGGSPAAVSFWDADPAPVAIRLRQQGIKATVGAAARIPDRSAGRAAARETQARQRRAIAAVRGEILARSGRRLSEWTGLDAAQLDVLLLLLAALASTRPADDGTRIASTGDGLWIVRSEPAPIGAPSAVLSTAEGRLAHPDVRLFVRSSDTSAEPVENVEVA